MIGLKPVNIINQARHNDNHNYHSRRTTSTSRTHFPSYNVEHYTFREKNPALMTLDRTHIIKLSGTRLDNGSFLMSFLVVLIFAVKNISKWSFQTCTETNIMETRWTKIPVELWQSRKMVQCFMNNYGWRTGWWRRVNSIYDWADTRKEKKRQMIDLDCYGRNGFSK